MVWDRRFHALIPRNPIVVYELRRQQRMTSRTRGFLESVGIVVVALGFLTLMLLSVTDQWRDLGQFYLFDPDQPIQILAWIFHAAVVLRFLVAGALIAKDGYLIDSPDLKLTPLTNRQLFIGKWWAALHQVRAWMLALGIVQLGIVFAKIIDQITYYRFTVRCERGGINCVTTIEDFSSPLSSTTALILCAAVIGIAVLETLCCTALGTAVSIAVRNKLGIFWAVLLRFAPVLIFSVFPDYHWGWPGIMVRYYQYTWFSFADSGTSALIRLSDFRNYLEAGLLRLYATIGMLSLYLFFSLMLAQVVMQQPFINSYWQKFWWKIVERLESLKTL